MLDPASFADRRLLAWMLVIGAFATTNTGVQAWFLDTLRKTVGDLQIRAIGSLRNLLEDYFYLDSMQRKALLGIKTRLFDN
jgi:hypothetical protein